MCEEKTLGAQVSCDYFYKDFQMKKFKKSHSSARLIRVNLSLNKVKMDAFSELQLKNLLS